MIPGFWKPLKTLPIARHSKSVWEWHTFRFHSLKAHSAPVLSRSAFIILMSNNSILKGMLVFSSGWDLTEVRGDMAHWVLTVVKTQQFRGYISIKIYEMEDLIPCWMIVRLLAAWGSSMQSCWHAHVKWIIIVLKTTFPKTFVSHLASNRV